MWPSFFCLLHLQSRWQLDRKRNRKGLKDLLLLSFSFKDKRPLDNFPQCSLHGGLCDQYLWESTGIWQTAALTIERRKKVVSLVFFCFFTTHSLSLVALSLREASGFIYPKPGILEDPFCPLRLQGLCVLQCGSLLLWKRGARACQLVCLDHLKALIHRFPCFARPLVHPRCPEAWLVWLFIPTER